MKAAIVQRTSTCKAGSISQNDKVARALAALEAALPKLDAMPIRQGRSRWASSSAIAGFGGTWRKDYPRLVAWHDNFAARVLHETKVEAS